MILFWGILILLCFLNRERITVEGIVALVPKNSVIFHYCGKNKPWKKNYSGAFGIFYKETLARMGSACEAEGGATYA